MAVCGNCSAQNPDSSLYCQDCGSRLGDWKPAEGPSRSATPPTGLSREGGSGRSSITSDPACPRCGLTNAAHMRFCNNCGFQLDPEKAKAAVAAAAAAPESSEHSAGGACWRCYGVGDEGAEFCKFCGARYADAPASRAEESGDSSRSPSRGSRSKTSADEPPRAADNDRRSGTAGPAVSSGGETRASLVSILKDGSDGRRYPVTGDETDIGREEGQIILTDDPYLSARHARLIYRGGKPVLRDLDSVNGVYMRIHEPVDVAHGDMMLLGQQVLRFELLAETELPLGPAMQHGVMVFGTPEVQRVARLVQYTTEGVGRDVHYLYRDETVIGREQGDLVFTDDPFMSRRHAALTVDRSARRYVLRDLGSSNGSAVRFKGERALRSGDQFRVGRHLFRFETEGG